MRKNQFKIHLCLVVLLLFTTISAQSVVHASGKEATIVSHTIPTTMQAGVTYPVSITVRNDGTEEWSEKLMYRLGGVDDGDPFTLSRQYLSDSVTVKAGQTITFSFYMTAPAVQGNYTTDWRMLQENVAWFGATLTLQVAVVQKIPFSSATIISDNIPVLMAKGYLYPVTISVRNDGGDNWSPEALYRLGGVGDSDPFANTRQLIPDGRVVKPGEVQNFTFLMQAPESTGSYITDWRMVHDLVTWFGQTLTKSVQVIEPYRDSAIVAHTIPSAMEAGQTYNVSITVKNMGNTSWYEDGSYNGQYRLGAAGDNDVFAQGRCKLPSGVFVKPGEEYTFYFQMKAPATAGTYITDWSMLQEYVTWFGAVLVQSVTVVDPAKTNLYHYDSAGRLEYIKLTSGKYIRYYYDRNGNLLEKALQDKI